MTVASTVRAELARRDKTQADLAAVLHLSTAAVSRRLSGQVPWDLVELDATARFLGLPVSALIGKAA